MSKLTLEHKRIVYEIVKEKLMFDCNVKKLSELTIYQTRIYKRELEIIKKYEKKVKQKYKFYDITEF